jgi:hypothetical protein
LTNYTSVFVVTNSNSYSATNGGAGTLVSQSLNSSLANGVPFNLLFTWKHNVNTGTQPPASIDAVSLTYTYCNGDPTVGAASASPATINCNGSSLLSLPGLASYPGLQFQWESSPDNSNWTEVTGATASSHNATDLMSSTYFRCVVTCPNTGATGQSGGVTTGDPVQVDLALPPNAGNDSSLVICPNGAPVDLFVLLGDSAQSGGVWNGPSPAFVGLFDPTTMVSGDYVYTITGTAPCPDASATVSVLVDPCLGIDEQVAYDGIRWLGREPDGSHVVQVTATEVKGWEVFDTTGRAVSSGMLAIREDLLRIPLGKERQGIYIIQLTTGQGIVVLRVVN